MFIKVWCEYDIGGDFGGNNNEDVFEVDDGLTAAQINQLVEEKFSDLFEDIKEEDDESFLNTGLLGWETITINKLGE
jgi:hypothetical protein